MQTTALQALFFAFNRFLSRPALSFFFFFPVLKYKKKKKQSPAIQEVPLQPHALGPLSVYSPMQPT